MAFRITVENTSGSFPCRGDQAVLAAMNAAFDRSIATGCRSGGCGVCKVRVLSGTFDAGPMSAAEISPADRDAGIVLACQIYPRSDLSIETLGRRSSMLGLLSQAAIGDSRIAVVPVFQP